jgi:hypothetical protein
MTYHSPEASPSVPDLIAELTRIRAAIRTRRPASSGGDEVTADDLFRLYARARSRPSPALPAPPMASGDWHLGRDPRDRHVRHFRGRRELPRRQAGGSPASIWAWLPQAFAVTPRGRSERS